MVRAGSPLMSGLLVPATALAVALAPAVVAPTPVAPKAVPVVHLEEIQLAGIGQDIYNAITPVVQTVVGDVSYVINFIPIVGAIAAAQININYFQGIQPSIAATVNYAAALVSDPLDLFPITRAYLDTLLGIGRDVVSAELRWLGLNELPARPTRNDAPSPRVAAARKAVPKAAETAAPTTKRLSRTHARTASPAHQGRKSGETRRQKSTIGRTRAAI